MQASQPEISHGRPGLSDEEKKARGARLKALRAAVFGKRFTQDHLADRMGVERTVVVKLETGRNAATAADIQRDLAKTFGLLEEDFAAYLEGEVDLARTMLCRDRVKLVLTKDVDRAVKAQPRRWHAGTLLLAAERVRHLKGAPEGGAVRFLDELERGVPVGSLEQAEALADDILPPTTPKSANARSRR